MEDENNKKETVKLFLKNQDERLTVAKILINNGFTVKIDKAIAPGEKTKSFVVMAWKE